MSLLEEASDAVCANIVEPPVFILRAVSHPRIKCGLIRCTRYIEVSAVVGSAYADSFRRIVN